MVVVKKTVVLQDQPQSMLSTISPMSPQVLETPRLLEVPKEKIFIELNQDLLFNTDALGHINGSEDGSKKVINLNLIKDQEFYMAKSPSLFSPKVLNPNSTKFLHEKSKKSKKFVKMQSSTDSKETQ